MAIRGVCAAFIAFQFVIHLDFGMAHAAKPSDGHFEISAEAISSGGGTAASSDASGWHTTGQSSALGASGGGAYGNFPGLWEVPEPAPGVLGISALLVLMGLAARRRN